MTFGPIENVSGTTPGMHDPDVVHVIVNPNGAAVSFPSNPNGNATPVVSSGTGASSAGTVNGAGTQVVAAANANRAWLTVQNTDAANDLYLSFTSPATTSDIKIVAGGSITMTVAPTNALYGLSSAVSTTFAVMEVDK